MAYRLVYDTVRHRPRKAIHVVRVLDAYPELIEIEEIADRMRQRALSRHGDQTADVVVVVGDSKNTLRLFGPADCVACVRAAMFNATMSWKPIELD
jgi:hypothetical protein